MLDTTLLCRMLIFSPSPIEAVRFKVDDDDWVDCRNIRGPLYVADWDPLKYSSGVHQISVRFLLLLRSPMCFQKSGSSSLKNNYLRTRFLGVCKGSRWPSVRGSTAFRT
jgi:hypothetical protein